MSKSHDKIGLVSNTDEKIQQQPPQPKIIQIPVQHIRTTPSREESPLHGTSNTIKQPKYYPSSQQQQQQPDLFANPGFSNRSNLFDRFESPFGNKRILSFKIIY